MSEILHKPLFIIQEIHIVKGKSTFSNRQSLENISNGSEPPRAPLSDWSRPNPGVSVPSQLPIRAQSYRQHHLLNLKRINNWPTTPPPTHTSPNKMSCRIAGSAVRRFSQSLELIEQVRGMPRSLMQDFCRMEMHVRMRFDKVVRIGMFTLRIHGKALAHQQDICRRRR